jgi:hypothetical protein
MRNLRPATKTAKGKALVLVGKGTRVSSRAIAQRSEWQGQSSGTLTPTDFRPVTIFNFQRDLKFPVSSRTGLAVKYEDRGSSFHLLFSLQLPSDVDHHAEVSQVSDWIAGQTGLLSTFKIWTPDLFRVLLCCA